VTIGSVRDLRDLEALQRKAWRCKDVEIVPAHYFQAQLHHGGCLLGAYSGDTLSGFVFAFRAPGYLYSHLAAVDPSFQGQGIGYALKMAQREWALERGFESIRWTFDPLQKINAHLNLHKLGAVGVAYHIDYYGRLDDELNAGLPSDRLEVEWPLDSRRHDILRRLKAPDEVDLPSRLRLRQDLSTAMAEGLVVVDFIEGHFALGQLA